MQTDGLWGSTLMKVGSASLQKKILLGVVMPFAAVVVAIIGANYYYQQKTMEQQLEGSMNILADSVYNAILSPMAIGDSETIRQQMAEFRKNNAKVRVFIFGFDKLVTYSSEPERVNSFLPDSVKSQAFNHGLDSMFATGKIPSTMFENSRGGARFKGLLHPLVNEKRCYHCHGATHETLGGIFVEQNCGSMVTAGRATLTTNIVIGLVGLLLGLLVALKTSHHIIRGLRIMSASLQDIVEGEGDLTKRIAVKGKDEIAEIAGWFNLFIEKLQNMIRDIGNNAVTLASSSIELAAISHHMGSGVEKIAEGAGTVSCAAEESSANTRSVAAKTGWPWMSCIAAHHIRSVCHLACHGADSGPPGRVFRTSGLESLSECDTRYLVDMTQAY